MNETNQNRMHRIKSDKQDKKKYLSKIEFLMVKGNQSIREKIGPGSLVFRKRGTRIALINELHK